MVQNVKHDDDLRVRRTRKLLQEAFIKVTVEKGFGAVTVRDITERAMVNRSTFYRHYLDKYDLLDQYMDEVYQSTTAERVAAQQRGAMAEGVPAGLVWMLRHIQEFSDFYRVMLGAQGDPRFIQRFRENSEKRWRDVLVNHATQTDPNMPPVDMRLSYISCAAIGAILWWLENDQPCSVEELACWLGQLNSTSAGFPPTFHKDRIARN